MSTQMYECAKEAHVRKTPRLQCEPPAIDLECNFETQDLHPIRRPGSPKCCQECAIQSSGAEVLPSLLNLLRKCLGQRGFALAHSFANAAVTPPITAQTLSELDIDHIVLNAQLRHDVNFDTELHFRPNLESSKVRQKVSAAEQYWTALVAELELFALLAGEPSTYGNEAGSAEPSVNTSQKRLPLMFETIKDILLKLVPEVDQPLINEVFDVPLLMQQIRKGVCDMVALAKWLANLLKAHCAPMRDEWVDKMVKQIEYGVAQSDSQSIVNGLRELLGILEAMKLDVANHQIRHLRLLLIEDTMLFEQRHHVSRISRGRVEINYAQDWLNNYGDDLQYDRAHADIICAQKLPNDLGCFVYALTQSLLSPESLDSTFPNTFYLDLDRLAALRADLIDQIHIQICLATFEKARQRLQGCSETSSSTEHDQSQALLIIVGAGYTHDNSLTRWTNNIANLAAHLTHTALKTTSSTQAFDLDLLDSIEAELKTSFNPDSDSYSRTSTAVLDALLPGTLKGVATYIERSPVNICNALVSPSTSSGKAIVKPTVLSGLGKRPEDSRERKMQGLIDRITHLAVLHWRIWAPIVYLFDLEDEDCGEDGSEQKINGIVAT
ncbi:MAG: hypothetical protein M1820_004231 [Bogoriella megaspora]|nr:MAG: hypothetical protein M1820_004231 [Bogoriella megaspora]